MKKLLFISSILFFNFFAINVFAFSSCTIPVNALPCTWVNPNDSEDVRDFNGYSYHSGLNRKFYFWSASDNSNWYYQNGTYENSNQIFLIQAQSPYPVLTLGSSMSNIISSSSYNAYYTQPLNIQPFTITCTDWTYSEWGDCQSDSTQTRTILTSSPENCEGGTPDILSQPCFYSGQTIFDTTTYMNLNYGLGFIYPRLDENYHADVQPSATFKVKLKYTIPPEKYEDTQFVLKQCASLTGDDCDIIGTSTIQAIRDILTDSENGEGWGYVYMEVPVVLDSYTILIAELGDNPSEHKIILVPASLKGVNDVNLPFDEGATLNNGDVRDLGYWGNLIRDLFIPTPAYFQTKTIQLKNSFYSAFPSLIQIEDIFDTNSLTDDVSVPDAINLTLYGSTTNLINFDILSSTIATIRM